MHNLFFFCAIVGSTLVVVQFVAALFGFGGSDLDSADASDIDVVGDAESGSSGGLDGGVSFLKALSFRTLSAGVAFWGFGGLTAESLGLGTVPTLGVAIFGGFAAIIVVYYLLRALSSFNHNGAIRTDSALDSVGSVYVRIPAKRGGIGKVIITQQERTMEYDALTDEENDLLLGTPIRVTSIVSSSQVLVATIKD